MEVESFEKCHKPENVSTFLKIMLICNAIMMWSLIEICSLAYRVFFLFYFTRFPLQCAFNHISNSYYFNACAIYNNCI